MLYEVITAQGYFTCGKKDQHVSFDYYFRTNPYKSGFTIFAGLYDFVELLQQFTYSDSDIEFLSRQGLDKEFLNYLRNFKFNGSIYSVREGDIVFPNEPLIP